MQTNALYHNPFKGEIIVYSRSTINAYSLLSHKWWVPLIKFMVRPTNLCERREYAFMVLWEYLIIFPSKVCKKGKSSSIFAKKKRSLSLSHSQICGSPSLLRSWFHSLRLVGPWLAILDSLFFTLRLCSYLWFQI